MIGRRPDIEAHGVSRAEQAIITRLDAGESVAAVAAALGMRLSSVAIVARRYIIGEHQLNAFDRQCRNSEARYRAALTATGKVYA